MSSFSPSTAELALVNNVFAVADPQKLGIITGDKAVEAFSGANLPPSVLGEIWTIADKENNGFLTRKGVAIALRLIGHAQKGEKVNESLLERPGPLAHIEGVSPKPSILPSSPPKSPPLTALHPPLTPEDKTKFLRLFLGCGPVNGLLSGDKARDVFVKSKLPFETLSQIWTLADTQDRGSLDQTDFTIAMYFIQAIMSGQLKSLPATLPPGLYEQAGGRGPTGVVSHGTGNSMTSLSPSLTGFFSPAATTPTPLAAQTTGTGPRRLQPQITGQEYSRLSMAIPNQPSVHFAPNPVTALGASAFGTATQAWDVTPEEKTRFDQFFDSLDTTKRGFIEGDVAVPFMLQSKLSEDVLAQVWDLADLNNDGRLTRDGFAVAMHLIQGKLAGKEIPATLPVSLVPPAMRAPRLGGAAQVSTTASAPAPVPEPIRDLLWDDSPPASATSPPPASTFGSPSPTHATPVLQPQLTGRVSQQHIGVASPKPPSIPPRANDPFGAAPFSPPPNRDLLSDDEGTPSSSVPDNSAEIGNVQNQLNSTNRSLETTKAERQTVESSLATQASQLSALQTQLSSAKAAYETETKLLETLRERFAAQSKDIAQTREQLISAESDLSALRVEKAEVEGAVLRDKEEVRELQRRMKEVGEEAERTKAAIEKAKKETKHQKGLLAIAKKQLATREAERAKLAKELEDAERETHETIEGLQATEAELAKEPEPIQTNGIASPAPVVSEPPRMDTPSIAAQQPLPASPPPSIGSPTSAKATNPFERLMIQSTGSRPASPFAAPTTDIFSAPAPQTRPPTETIQASPFAPFEPEQKTTEVSQAAHVVAAESSTSTTGPASSIDDPFGLGDADKSSATSIAESPDKTSALAPDFVTSPIAVESQDKTATPPMEPEVLSKVPEKSPSSTDVVDAAAKHFPAVDSQVPSGIPANIDNDAHTDLNSKLVEKEAEESDTDSDNERDFHDAKEARTSTGSAFDESTKGLAMRTTNKSLEPTPTMTSNTFEDAFGLKENEPKAETSVSGLPENKDTMTDLFFSEPQPIDKAPVNGEIPESSSPFDNVPTATSGVNAFDEAMGKISTPGASSAAPRFQLDSTFDDNFDFNAAKAELEPTLASASVPPVPVLNGSSQEPPKTVPDFGSTFTPAPSGQDTTPKVQEANKPALSFDDAFGSTGSSQMSSRPSQPSVGDLGISFEDAFGGGGDQALALNFNAPSASTSITTQSRQPDTETTTQRIQSPPRSPQVTAPPGSPPAARSPSPPLRRSTGSSTDGSVHGKPPPQHRHSKLSIRLPFGRKDKKKTKHEPPPVPPPRFLTPVTEPQGTTGTPAVEDDVEPVKQLCSMGFSRTQAVEALEKHGYDVQRALNSLLGTA